MRKVDYGDGVYEISAVAYAWGAHRVLPDAVPMVSGRPSDGIFAGAARSLGWVQGACPAPNKADHYLVEFVDKRAFRIIAYVDRYGRVFTTDRPLNSPPARHPDLNFVRYEAQGTAGAVDGCVEVPDENGDTREVARFRCVHDRYTLFDSWYDFGPYAESLCYDDALARAYFAFVYRPSQGAPAVPERGVSLVKERLRRMQLLPALKSIMIDVRRAQEDPLLKPPALLCNLAQWLNEAGLVDIAARSVPDEALRLARTARYANTYYVACEDDDVDVSHREVWALEAALNRYLLLDKAFGDRASLASDADVSRWDAYLIETAGAQQANIEKGPGTPQGAPDGEWEVRCGIGAALERLQLPFRIDVRLRVDVSEGIVAFDMITPDVAFMPRRRWVEPAGSVGDWEAVPQNEREAQARRYAMHLGLALAAAAFSTSCNISRVDIVAHPFKDDTSDVIETSFNDEREFPADGAQTAYFQAMLLRESFEVSSGFDAARNGDPLPFLMQMGAVFDIPDADPFAVMAALPVLSRRRLLPESADEVLAPEVSAVLGAEHACDIRIDADACRRRIGEGVADRVATAGSATEAIRIVREEQEAARGCGDERTAAAATRLMAALAEGSLDMGDQNAVVGCFLGEDRCLAALARARACAQKDPDQAVSILVDAIGEAAALDGYVDGTTTVYRSFDSYAARLLYNRAIAAVGKATDVDFAQGAGATPSLEQCAAADAGKRVELVPDSFYLCHVEIVRLLEHSFERTDEALFYGRRAVGLAPTIAAGYRQLGRAFMLVGDMDNAAAVLSAGLRIAVQPPDIAIAYYQLAYALWKAGRARAGAACYLKSLMTAPTVAAQATVELRELLAENDLGPIERGDVDALLGECGVVVAPTEQVVSLLDAGAAAATDADLFPVARNLLSLRLHYRSDDALVNVLRSLGSVSV